MNKNYRELTGAQLYILPDLSVLAEAAAQIFATGAAEAIRNKGWFAVALSGGSTPTELFSQLAASYADELDWSSIHIFWGDERHVSPTDAASNYRLAKETLLDHVPLPSSNIHRIHSEEPDCTAVARAYELELHQFFKLAPGERPRFDLVLLGLGDDGHTASLFPNTGALQETERLVVCSFIPKLNAERITLTYPVINNAAMVLVLISGASKNPAVQGVLNRPSNPKELPMQGIHLKEGRLMWLLDVAAATGL